MSIELKTPISEKIISSLKIGDTVNISGYILCGRDAVLPKIVNLIDRDKLKEIDVNLNGNIIFHTAVSPAGVGPTSSNKLEIETSMEPLSRAGIRIHLGKGTIHKDTVEKLNRLHSIYAIIPPVTALLKTKIIEKKLIAFPELGMEAFYQLKVDKYPAIIAAANGRSIYDEKL